MHPLACLVLCVALVVGPATPIEVSVADAVQEASCKHLSPGPAFGMCRVYCEVLLCGTPQAKDQEACAEIFDVYLQATGNVPPCFACSAPDPNVFCLQVYDPVICGGCTYSNSCYAQAAGFVPGHCRSTSR